MELPDHFTRATARGYEQVELFESALEEVIKGAGVELRQLVAWHALGWTAINPDDPNTFAYNSGAAVSELKLLRVVTTQETWPGLLGVLLREFGAPLALDVDRIAWSPKHGWVEPAFDEAPLEATRDHLDEYLNSLKDEGALERLLEIQRLVTDAIEGAVTLGKRRNAFDAAIGDGTT